MAAGLAHVEEQEALSEWEAEDVFRALLKQRGIAETQQADLLRYFASLEAWQKSEDPDIPTLI